jgi:hypothetical protein
VFNAVHAGFTVGVAGVLGFLPARQCSRPTARRIGQLQKFRILSLERSTGRLLLADPSLSHAPTTTTAASPSQQQPGRSRRPPRDQAEALRRQELARVADELRSVLALRSDGGGSKGGAKVGGKGPVPA